MNSDELFDFIVVGAGAAGCVVASRLAEDPRVRVLLVEAGPDIPPGNEPDAITDPFPVAYTDSRYIWPGLQAEVGADRGDGEGRFTRNWIQARLVGGGSNINGMLAQRGAPADFAEWVAAGATGWSWEDVLPFYRRLESDLDFGGPMHGDAGPIPIRRHSQEQWPGFSRAFSDAALATGLSYIPDIHAGHVDGVSPATMNNLADRRMGAAQQYLGPTARARRNLVIIAQSTVERVLIESKRATGVRVHTLSGIVDFRGREVVLSGGAIHTPSVLMRSGIGDASSLAVLGIPVECDLPGVGRGLQNHPAFHLAAHLPVASTVPATRAPFHVLLRFSSQLSGCPPTDMAAFAVPRAAWHALGARIGAVSVFVHKPYSRGSVQLTSSDVAAMPRVNFNLLADHRDMQRLVIGARRMLELFAHPLVAGVTNEVFLPGGGHANAFNRVSRLNWAKSHVAARLFDLGPSVRRKLLKATLIDPAAMLRDPHAIEQAVLRTAACVHHPAGSCRIGPAHDRASVVDAHCRVHGIDGVRVADTSVMPTIVTAGTHLSALMIGEKVAQMIKDEAIS